MRKHLLRDNSYFATNFKFEKRDDMSLNKRALELFENNEYDEAFQLFKEASEVERGVQSLNNLAWMYLNEEEDKNVAKELLQEVLTFSPKSHFPYNMLGEIAVREGRFEEAKNYLKQALAICHSNEAIHNLAIANFYLDEFKQAAKEFAQVAKDSDLVRLNEVVARIKTGEVVEAKAILDGWNDQADHYTGAIIVADVYMELPCYKDARRMFAKEWTKSINGPYIVSRYAYTLMQLGEIDECMKVINDAIVETDATILDVQQEPCDEHWTEAEKLERLEELQAEKAELKALFQKLQAGFLPPFEYELYPTGGCYLFGCKQHGHKEYK